MQQQQQKQREHPEQAPRNAGEIIIAILDLLIGLPLALIFTAMFLKSQLSPSGLLAWLMFLPWLLLVLGLVPAGLLILLRQCRLARAFQWLAALAGVGFALIALYTGLSSRQTLADFLLGLGAVGLALLLLLALPIWLRKLTED